jgi:hypothetical protein
MNNFKLILCAGAASLGLAWAGAAAADTAPAAPAAPAPTPMAQPAMGATIAANPNPGTFDAGPLGKLTVDGVITGIGFYQSPSQFTTGHGLNNVFDVSNAQVIINKSDGPIQFYMQAGAYSFPTVGVPYTKSFTQVSGGFGVVPQGFIKFVPNSTLSVEVGALPTLIGSELAFTFQNMNIQRGLLWNTEPLVSKGIQGNVTLGSWSGSLAITDGYYTGTYTNVSGLLSYTFKNSDVLTFAAEGNAGVATSAGSLANGQVYNLIYTHVMGPWTINPYIQYQTTPNIAGVSQAGTIWAGAVLAKYSFNAEWSLAGRIEYESSGGSADLLGYGAGSNAFSLTLTPTYQKGIFFARAEFSYVGLGNYAHSYTTSIPTFVYCDEDFLCEGPPTTSFTNGEGFGGTGDNSSQYRVGFETGLVF